MCGCEHRTSHAGGVVPPGPWPVAGWAHVVSATLVPGPWSLSPGPWSLVPGPWPVAGWAHVVSVTLKKPSRRPLWVCFALPPHCVSSLKAYLHQHNA